MVTVSSVANASRGELLCLTYELLLEKIELAKKSEGVERKKYLDESIKTLRVLVGDLNYEVALSKDLFNIYVYVQGLLVNGKSETKIDEAYKLIHKLYEGFKKVAENETRKQPIMENTQELYAGLTYGKGDINETAMSSYNRGYKA